MRQLIITKQITNRDDASIDRYFQEINRYPMITPEEEVNLSERIRAGDVAALEKLVVANLRFVVSVAKQYQNQGLGFTDLINEGNLGLVKAAQKFDETRGFKFISYAVWWIRQSIIMAISTHTRTVRLPLNRIVSINKVARAIPLLEQEYEREPTPEEIAGFLNMNETDVEVANRVKMRQVSFDAPVVADGNDDFSLYDIVQKEDIPSPDEHLMVESVTTNLNRALQKLSRRESEVLVMTFGLFQSPVYTLNEIAEEYDITTERARQIRVSALNRLKVILKGNCNFIN
jgi:RNA polymerase primary sigma factor